MTRSKLLVLFACIVALAGGLLVFTGCEDDPETDPHADDYFAANPFESDTRGNTESPLLVTPDNAQVDYVGQQVTFRVQGGVPNYQWHVGNTAYGSVTVYSGNGDTARYKTKVLAPNTVVVRDALGRARTMPILTPNAPDFSVIPGSAVFTSGATNAQDYVDNHNDLDNLVVNFSAVGGMPPYVNWTVSFPGLGFVTNASPDNSTVQYWTSGGIGSNLVWVTDSGGGVAIATVVTVFSDPE